MIAPSSLFHQDSRKTAADNDRRSFIRRALGGYYKSRDTQKSRFTDWEAARQSAAEIKYDAVNSLDECLLEFEKKFTRRGGVVHWASNATEAREIVMQIARERGVKSIIKSKTMTSEEIHLNDALEEEGYDVVESDLGEYIMQLQGKPPYHFVFPCMHLKREEIREIFDKEFGGIDFDDPEKLTMVARRVLRQKYCQADMGISGGNFIVAETGTICITENEGNARLTCALPKIHVALVGIEKVLRRVEDLALFFPMLGTAGAGQPMTCYNSLYSGPRQPGETDGPEEFHVVLLDNQRTTLLADAEQRDALHCIRCGACLNVCPIFKNVGGHTYGTTYQGPIGAVITPHLRGLQSWKHLSNASSLCGACTEACPVKIDLHHHLLRSRRNAMAEKPIWWEAPLWVGFRFMASSPGLYRFMARLAPIGEFFHKFIKGSAVDPVGDWTRTREFPNSASQNFKDWWDKHREQGKDIEVQKQD